MAWNDASSLRLLSKVLASLDGLEKDALIAISAQFSILNRSIHEEDEESEMSETGFEKYRQGSGAKQEGVRQGGDQDALANESQDDHLLSSVKENSADDSIANQIELLQHSFVNNVGEEQNSDEEEEQQTSDEEEEEQTSDEEEEEEDLNWSWRLNCDGNCGTEIRSWTEPFYYCLVCPNTDLCEPCHTKRLQQTRGETEKPWFSFCSDEHRYIKGPMKNWKGIWEGVIRIGDEELTVKDWLHDLKKNKWKEAWKVFWTRQGGLKDIGFEN